MNSHGIIQDEWILSYASGALSTGHALVVASHIEAKPELMSRLQDAEAIGGSLLDDIEPAVIDEAAFDTLFDDFAAANDENDNTQPVQQDSDIPPSLARYLKMPLRDVKWSIIGPGMYKSHLWTGDDNEKLWLLKANAGIQIPVHDHRGLEMTLILQGGYTVGDKHFTKGLIDMADVEVKNHSPLVDKGDDCICLVLTEASVKPHSLLGRMVQPFIGV